MKRPDEDYEAPDLHPAVQEDIKIGFDWYWNHSRPRLSSFMTDHLLGDDLLPGLFHMYSGARVFHLGWSQAQEQHKRLKRLRIDFSSLYTQLGRLPYATVPRCSLIFTDEEKGRKRLLIPALHGPYEIPLPLGIKEANSSERAVTIAIAEMTVGHGCTLAEAPDFYLHMVTGLQSLKATARAVEGALRKGCIHLEHKRHVPIYSLTNVNTYARELNLIEMERVEMYNLGIGPNRGAKG